MASEHAEIWVQPPPAPVQNLDALVHNPAPAHEQEKVASDDLLLLGMMVWMEQGLVLEWLQPAPEKTPAEKPERPKKD